MKTIKVGTKLDRAGERNHYFPIPEKAAKKILDSFGKRVICSLNKEEIHCAILRSNARGYYIMVSKTSKKKFQLESQESVVLNIQKDDSTFQIKLSEEFYEVLNTDSEGMIRFEGLTDGKKRSLIHYINSAKQSDTKITRALKILENLKIGITNLKDLLR